MPTSLPSNHSPDSEAPTVQSRHGKRTHTRPTRRRPLDSHRPSHIQRTAIPQRIPTDRTADSQVRHPARSKPHSGMERLAPSKISHHQLACRLSQRLERQTGRRSIRGRHHWHHDDTSRSCVCATGYSGASLRIVFQLFSCSGLCLSGDVDASVYRCLCCCHHSCG